MSAIMRIGVAGAGLIGRKHIESIETSPDGVVAGIADPSAEAMTLAATHHFLWSLDPLVEQLRHVLGVITRRETPLISVEDAAGTLVVVKAVREAAQTGARVSPGQIMEQTA
jgi:predicted dehydrogenase